MTILRETLFIKLHAISRNHDFNALIDIKPFSGQPVKNKEEACEKRTEISRNDDHTTGNLLGCLYHQNHYKLISIDLSRQTNTIISQQINFTGK